MDYVRLEDETLPIQDTLKHIKGIKKAIKSIELPMVDLPIDTIKDIFDIVVVADPENYVFVINSSNKDYDKESLKKVTEISPLLESKSKVKIKNFEYINWKIVPV